MTTTTLEHSVAADQATPTWSLAAALAGFAARYSKVSADRALRRELAGLDAHVLRDIGIAEDEIQRIRSEGAFTPRAWS